MDGRRVVVLLCLAVLVVIVITLSLYFLTREDNTPARGDSPPSPTAVGVVDVALVERSWEA
jgi:hypothetical protein